MTCSFMYLFHSGGSDGGSPPQKKLTFDPARYGTLLHAKIA